MGEDRAAAGATFRLESTDSAVDDETEAGLVGPTVQPPPALSLLDTEYYYTKDVGYRSHYSTLGLSDKPKVRALTPVAEVAPRLSFDDDRSKSTDERDLDRLADKSMKESTTPVVTRATGESPTRKVVVTSGPSTSKALGLQSRESTAEILVALSEQRRNLAVAETDSAKRKSIAVSNSKRKSVAPDGDSVDPLRANLQMLYECFYLIKRNQRQLMFNAFLILLVALILTSMIIFARFDPPPSEFEIVLTPWATFWPLGMRLLLYQLGHSKDTLTLYVGNAGESFTYQPPSYCACCTEDAPECDSSHQQERCWCFNWQSIARLYITSVDPVDEKADCLILEWRSSSKQQVQATDCFQTSLRDGARWYGGPLTIEQSWPVNVNVTEWPFVPYLVNDVQTHPKGIYGAAEPLWVSNNGFAVMASLDNPFSVNRSDTNVCLRSNDLTKAPLRYMVCRADDTRAYTINISALNDYATLSYPESDEDEMKGDGDEVVGTIFVNYDSSEVTADELITMEQTMASLKLAFGIAFENFDLFNETMAENLIESIEKAEETPAKGDLPAKAVEVNNFIRFYHLRGRNGQQLQGQCVTQSEKDIIGVSKWRDNVYACLDFTRSDVADWFVQLCSTHVINNVTDYLAFAGGDADTLPVLPNLNLSNEQTNFYSTLYARTASSVPKSILVDVAYNTHRLSNVYVNLAMSSDDVRSMIPLMLTMSLQGYSRFAFNLVNYSIPAGGWIPTPHNTDPLFTWLELAMFSPVFRIPRSVLDWSGFGAVVKRFLPFREQIILKHYNAAASENALGGEPIYKPIWWMDYEDYRDGRYPAHEARLWSNDKQFMLGNDLLVAAFLQVDGVEHLVYFPPGRWRNVETQGEVEGGRFIYIDTTENVACYERVSDSEQ